MSDRVAKYLPYRDGAASLAALLVICLGYGVMRSGAVIEALRFGIKSTVLIAGGPLTAWLIFFTHTVPTSYRVPASDPRSEITLGSIVLLLILTGMFCLPWILYRRQPSRAALIFSLAIWFASGWFFTFAIWT